MNQYDGRATEADLEAAEAAYSESRSLVAAEAEGDRLVHPRRHRVRVGICEDDQRDAAEAGQQPGAATPPHAGGRKNPERSEAGAGCHQSLAVGGMMPGARVPSLARATSTQLAEAVRIGPFVMPRFSRQRLSDAQLDSVIRYVQFTQSPHDPGGWPIGHLGPIPEGMVAWLIGGSALVVVTLLIGRRRRA